MTKRLPKKGEVIKFKQYYCSPCRTDPLMLGDVMWGIGVGNDMFDVLQSITDQSVLNRMKVYLTTCWPRSKWAIDPDEDVYKIIPESEWPDEVCVALAKRALMGNMVEEKEE